MHLGVGEQGRLATIDNALSWHGRFGLTRTDAIAIIDRIWRVVREWKTRFEDLGVPAADVDRVAAAFRHIDDIWDKTSRR